MLHLISVASLFALTFGVVDVSSIDPIVAEVIVVTERLSRLDQSCTRTARSDV